MSFLRSAYQIARLDFKGKYSYSIIGYLWHLLSPLLTFLFMFFIFHYVFKLRYENHSLYLIYGIVHWTFFRSVTNNATSIFNFKWRVVKDVGDTEFLLLSSSILVELFTFVINLLIFGAIYIVFGAPAWGVHLLLLPLVFVQMLLLTTGIGLIISPIANLYNDAYHAWNVSLQFIMWACPIFYTVEMVPEKFRTFYLLNPVAQTLNFGHKVLFKPELLELGGVLTSTVYAVFWYFLGLVIFKRLKVLIPEKI